MRSTKTFLVLFFALMIVGCFSKEPSNSQVLNHLKKTDHLAQHGCIKFENFQRVNGFERGTTYIVTYKVKKILLLNQEACFAKMKEAARGDPFETLGIAGIMWNSVADFMEFSMNGGTSIVEGKVSFIKSENGWIVNGD